MKDRFCITKWCKCITDDHKDIYTGRLPKMKEALKYENNGVLPPLFSFRLLDDDGIVYAYGKCTDDSSFAPLDVYGDAYGMTMIEYKNPETKEWEEL